MSDAHSYKTNLQSTENIVEQTDGVWLRDVWRN